MVMLVTGTRKGLGLEIATEFNADSANRADGYDITDPDAVKRIVDRSLDYDVFVNNAFDGPAAEPYGQFAQTKLLYDVFYAWQEAGKTGYIFNIGSIGETQIVTPSPKVETYRASKAALSHASRQCSHAFKMHEVAFKTSLLTMARMDLPHMRERDSWTGNGIDPSNIINAMKFIMSCTGNTIIEEITFLVDLKFVA